MSLCFYPEVTSLLKIFIINFSSGNPQRLLGTRGNWKKSWYTFPWKFLGSFLNVLARFLQGSCKTFLYLQENSVFSWFLQKISDKNESCKIPARNLRRIIYGVLIKTAKQINYFVLMSYCKRYSDQLEKVIGKFWVERYVILRKKLVRISFWPIKLCPKCFCNIFSWAWPMLLS